MAPRAPAHGRRAGLAAVLLVAASLAVPSAASASASSAEPPVRAERRAVFVGRDCPPDIFPEDRLVDCGYVEVPESRARPHGRTIRVAAAVVRARTDGPLRSPIVFLDGGPSFGAIAPFALDAYIEGAAYAEDRDVVLVDTRGTGFSRPRLGCPEFDVAYIESFYSGPVVDANYGTIFTQAVRRCRNRLEGRGIRLAAYDSKESAADLDDLRRALGYRRWNLLAISADGVLGSTYLRLYPEHVRSVVLDSPIAPQHLHFYDYLRGIDEMLDRVFDGCEADPECDATYPGIRGLFEAKIAELNEDPVLVSIPDFEPEPVILPVDGAWLWYDAAYGLWPGNVFEGEAITWTLDNIWRATHGDLVQMERDLIGTGPITSDANSFVAEGKTMSYLCRDVIGFMTDQDKADLLADLPWMARDFAEQQPFGLPMGPAGCRIWDVGTAAPVQHRAVVSDVPTLVLAGEFDLGVPAFMARQADDGLTNAHYYELPAAPHLQLSAFTSQSWCGREIATSFLDHPQAEPDASCLAELPPFDYSPAQPRAYAESSPARSSLARPRTTVPSAVCSIEAISPCWWSRLIRSPRS